MKDPCKMVTVRERGLVKLVKAKKRLNPNYPPCSEELIAMNAVELELKSKELHKADD